MSSASVGKAGGAVFGGKLLACVAEHGSAAHPYLSSHSLLAGKDAARNLSDAVHFLCMLHGRHPGVVDHAGDRCTDPAGSSWFEAATEAFAAERAFLTRLAVAAGPIPSTPGSADCEAAVLAQRHAIEMLARSERNGCALGAAMSLVIDWASVRAVLNVAARRFGVPVAMPRLADPAAVAEAAEAVAATAAVERAMLFGAEQIVLQHFGLWDLLEARQQARAAA